jgi:hypothetical protein
LPDAEGVALAWCIVLVRLVLPASWVSLQAVRLPAAYDVAAHSGSNGTFLPA